MISATTARRPGAREGKLKAPLLSHLRLPTMNSPLLPYAWMLASAGAFSLMAICTRALEPMCPWQVIAIFRAGLAMLFAAGLTYHARAQFAVLRPRILWMRSLAGSVSLVCGFYAMTHHSLSEVLVIT